MTGLAPRARVDLHMHSTRSDGVLDADALLVACAAAGLDVVALTDHDLPPAWAAGVQIVRGHTLRVVHGAEVSVAFAGRELHVLVYTAGEMPPRLRDFLVGRAQARAARYAEACARTGLPGLAPPDAAACAGARALTRHHVARAIFEAGHAPSPSAAFRQWLSGPASVLPPITLPLEALVAEARAAGALTAWAHPPMADAAALAPAVAAAGVDALEAVRPGIGGHGRAALGRLALKHGLAVVGGSDWHGHSGPGIGHFAAPGREVAPFLARLEAAPPGLSAAE